MRHKLEISAGLLGHLARMQTLPQSIDCCFITTNRPTFPIRNLVTALRHMVNVKSSAFLGVSLPWRTTFFMVQNLEGTFCIRTMTWKIVAWFLKCFQRYGSLEIKLRKSWWTSNYSHSSAHRVNFLSRLQLALKQLFCTDWHYLLFDDCMAQ